MSKINFAPRPITPSLPPKTIVDRVNEEPPIFGSTVLFELMRSTDLSEDEFDFTNESSVHVTNSIDARPSLRNLTNYYGFFSDSTKPTTFSFNRFSLVNSNPYIYLTDEDIKNNAQRLEQTFTCLQDTKTIKTGISAYWKRLSLYDRLVNEHVNNRANYPNFFDVNGKYTGYYPNMHLIYAYMMENTKMVQIFDRIITLYQNTEDLTIPYNFNNLLCRPWLDNTHLLFYSNSQYAAWDHNSALGSNFEAVRRNAYFRLFGLDLNFGIGENNTNPVLFHKAAHNNAAFIPQFENFLKLCWQMIINYANVASINTTDLIALQEQSDGLRDMLLARRTNEQNLNNYTLLNLSKVEYTSVVMMNWMYHAISYNSPIVIEMGAEGVTAAERLNRLGQRVGIPAHSKSANFIELAPLMATLLRLFELNEVNMTYITAIANPTTNAYALITTIIYNYQLATGRDIKNQVMINNANRQAALAR